MSTQAIRTAIDRLAGYFDPADPPIVVREALAEVEAIERAARVFNEAATSSGAGHPGLPDAVRTMCAIAKDAP
jgi:hypothetical protein